MSYRGSFQVQVSGCLAILAFSLVSSIAAYAQTAKYVPGEVIVKLKGQANSSASFAFVGKASTVRQMGLKRAWHGMNLYHFAVRRGQSVDAALQELRQDPSVQYAEPNYLVSKSSDGGIQKVFSSGQVQTMAQTQSYMATSANIGVQSVWSASGSVPAKKPIVAVIDTGLDTTHPVFTGSHAVWTNPNEIPGNGIDDDSNGYIDDVHGWNFVDNSPTMYDDDSHGTHVSGIILSVDQNIYTTPLQESKIAIMPLKFLNGSGVGSTSDAISAVYYAANNGASVINNSWGGTDYSVALNEAIAYAYNKGALFVAAAGNSATNNDSTPIYPAGYDVPNVVSVAATTDFDYLASFSDFGASSVHMGSPGVYILSTLPNGVFGTMSGTSMATPFVSGTAAQMKVSSPNMLAYQLRLILLNQIDTVQALAGLVKTSGRLDSALAVGYAKVASVMSSQPAYTMSYGSDRQLASNIAGGAGCGMVHKLENGEPPGWGSAGAVLALVLLPLGVLLYLRMRSPINRRKHERFKIDSEVRVSVGDRELVGSISSISLGGVQLNTSALLQDGGLVTLSISSPQGQEKVEVAGRVVWSDANKAYGVAFDQTPQSVLSRIADWTRILQRAN